MSRASECDAQLREVRRLSDIYQTAYNNWNYYVDEYKRQTKTALKAYDDAELYLISTPRSGNRRQVQGCDWWSGNACQSTCDNERSSWSVRGTRIYPGYECWDSGCWSGASHMKNKCGCYEPDPGEWQSRYTATTLAKTAWEEAQAREKTWVNSRPNPPTINVQCCVNTVTCPAGSRCDGNIQECQLQINQKFSQENEAQLQQNELANRNNIIRIKPVTDSIIQNLNLNLTSLSKNFTNLKSIDPNNDINTNVNKLTNIYNNSKTIYETMGTLIRDFLNYKTEATRYNSDTRANTTYKNEINTLASTINYSFDNARTIYASATDTYGEIRDYYDIMIKDKNNIDAIIKLRDTNDGLIKNINNDITKINNFYSTVNKQISTNEEDIKTIDKLTKDSNNLLNTTINNNLTTFNNNNEAVRKLFGSYGPNSFYLKNATELYNTVKNITTTVTQESDKIKNITNEIKKTSDALNNNLINFNNLLNIKSKIDSIIPSIDNDIGIINDFYTSANDFIVSNDEDVQTLEKIKIDAYNFFNNSKITENIKLINNFKDSADKLLKLFETNSVFNDKVNEIYQNISNITNINNQNYENVIKTIEDINNIYLNKKNKFGIYYILTNESKIQSDELLLAAIKEDELKKLKELEMEQEMELKNRESSDYTLYIIMGIVILLIIIVFFTSR